MKSISTILSATLYFVLSASYPAGAQSIMSLHLSPRADGIIGPDDRSPVEWGDRIGLSSTMAGRILSFDTRTIVRLLDSHGKFICSGSVVGPTTILTAAHCVKWDGAWRSRHRSRPMLVEVWNGTQFGIIDWVVSSGYHGRPLPSDPRRTSLSQFEIDVALLYTSRPISPIVGGFLGITKRDSWGQRDRTFDGTPVHLIGFHGDVDALRPKLLVKERCDAKYNRVKHLKFLTWEPRDYGRIMHNCDVTGGSSGSPLLSDNFNGVHIFGVNVAGGGTDDSGYNGLAMHVGAIQSRNRGIYQWLYRKLWKDRTSHGYRIENEGAGWTVEERYLTSEFQGPEDVRWMQ